MHKRNSKLQKELEGLTREKNKLKESLDAEKIRSEELTVSCAELRKNIDKLQGEKMLLETSEIKNKKELEQLAEKCKNDLVKLRKAKDV